MVTGKVGQYFNISSISDAIMTSQTFLQIHNIACAICREISLNITVGYCKIECTTSGMILKPIYSC